MTSRPRTLQSGGALALAVALLAVPLAAAGQGHDTGRRSAKSGPPANGRSSTAKEDSRRILAHYFGTEGIPPGLGKQRALPPGLALQVRERGPLPPGLVEHFAPLPAGLAKALPPLAPHQARYFAGADLLVIDTRMNVVVSIVADVLPVRVH